jgi:hypothetical protein
MPFTAGVGRANEVLTSMFVDFQIVSDAFALRTVTKDESIRWVLKTKVFHEILLRSESVTIGHVV